MYTVQCTDPDLGHTAKTQDRKFETNIPRKGIAPASVPISTFMCLWGIYIFPPSVCLFYYRKMCGLILGIYVYIAHRHMNVEIGTEATQFLFCEYVNGIFVTVHSQPLSYSHDTVPLKAQPGPWRFIKYLFRQDRSHHKSLTDTWMLKLGLRPCISFSGNT